MKYRTDLAIESMEVGDVAGENGRPGHHSEDGISFQQWKENDILVTKIEILDERGKKKLGKPEGTYITVEIEGLICDEEIFKGEKIRKAAAELLAKQIASLVPFDYYLKVLVVGLGNGEITPDSLGPETVGRVTATRHLFLAFDCQGDEEMTNVACLCPGVTGTTGLETVDTIGQVVELTKPDVVLVVDALAAKDIGRISTTIQICDTGIEPGAGMGNHRKRINQESLGVKVVAIGVPTVIDSKTLILDAMENGKWPAEQVEEYLRKSNLEMIVTSTDIDRVIEDFSEIIGNAINIAFQPGIYS